MTIEFFGGPFDGERVSGLDAERLAPFEAATCLIFGKCHIYGWTENRGSVAIFKFLKTLSESERTAMSMSEYRESHK